MTDQSDPPLPPDHWFAGGTIDVGSGEDVPCCCGDSFDEHDGGSECLACDCIHYEADE